MALQEDIPAPTPRLAEWSGVVQWSKKRDKAWIALERALKELLCAIKMPHRWDENLLDKVEESLVDYLSTAHQVRDARR